MAHLSDGRDGMTELAEGGRRCFSLLVDDVGLLSRLFVDAVDERLDLRLETSQFRDDGRVNLLCEAFVEVGDGASMISNRVERWLPSLTGLDELGRGGEGQREVASVLCDLLS